MNELHARNTNLLAQSIGVNPVLIDNYLNLLKTIYLLEE